MATDKDLNNLGMIIAHCTVYQDNARKAAMNKDWEESQAWSALAQLYYSRIQLWDRFLSGTPDGS